MPDGPRLVGLEIADAPSVWERAGFAVEGDRAAVGGVTLRFSGPSAEQRGVVGWCLEPDPGATVAWLPSTSIESVDADGEHPNRAVAVDHVVVGTSDLDETTEHLGRLGLDPHRTVEDVPGRGGAQFRFFLLGTCLLEVVAPGDREPEKSPRVWGLAVVSDDLDATVGLLGDASSQPRDAIQAGRRIATADREALGLGTRLAFMTPRPGR